MKERKNLFIAILIVLLMLCASIPITNLIKNKVEDEVKTYVKRQEVKEIYPYVFDAGTYTELDYNYAQKYFEDNYGNYGGGCTAIAKVNSLGDTIVGRNMDLNISNKAAYVFRTAVPDSYKTINLMYTFRDFSPDYKDVLENGLSEEFSKIMPFLADDVLNEKGLYVEVNMRNGEYWPTGEPKYSCSGTNPDSNTRVYMFTLSRYIGEHCATVDEALEYVKTLNVYSQKGYWNYCFLLADASGHYGVLEFGANEIYWNEMQQAQANFYINEELQSVEELKAGLGRYDKVMSGIDNVESEEDMFNLMDSASYFQVYNIDSCQWDWRSENVGALAYATNDFVMKEEYQDYIKEQMRQMGTIVKYKTRQELRDANEYWESAFTEVINCSKRTLFVRFYENDDMTLKLSFE